MELVLLKWDFEYLAELLCQAADIIISEHEAATE